VLVLRPGALGDALLAVPALRALHRAYRPLKLGSHPGAARLLATLGEVDAGLPFDDRSLSWVFSPEPREAFIAWTGATLNGATLCVPSRPPAMDRHCARHLLESLEPLGIDLTWDDTPLQVSSFVSDEVLIHTGSGSPNKNWPPEHFAAVVRALRLPVRLVVGEADGASADALDASLGLRLPRLEHPPLEHLAARLTGCRGYLGNDSGISHLAGLCGAPTLALFGPTDPRVWHPLGPHVEVLDFGIDPREVAVRLERA
jgi:heptosyltransferase-3